MIQTKVLHIYKLIPFRAGDGSVRFGKQLVEDRILSQRHAETPAKVFNRYEAYFLEMGISKAIMPMLLNTPNNDIHILTFAELRSTGMATHHMNGNQLVRGETVPGDGWAMPLTPLAPITSGPGDNTTDCTRDGKNCTFQFKPDIPTQGTTSIPGVPGVRGTSLPQTGKAGR
jgi:hypothetical protein